MRRPSHRILLFITLTSFPFFSLFANPCPLDLKELLNDSSSLNQKYELKEKLKTILRDAVEKEVLLQSEGILNPPERDKAKAIAMTLQKLQRVIQRQEESYTAKKKEFCQQCSTEFTDKTQYCVICSEKQECSK